MKDDQPDQITADMTILDIVSAYPLTEKILKAYDDLVGECICCQMLFETVETTAQRYDLDLKELLRELNTASKTQ